MSQPGFVKNYDYGYVYFNNPESKERDSVKLSYEELETFMRIIDSLKETEKLELPKSGIIIKKSAITGFKKVKIKNEEQEEHAKTRFETNPPSKEEWQALCAFVQDHFRWRAGTENIFLGTVKSIWNWDSQKTKDALETGREILKSKSEIELFS